MVVGWVVEWMNWKTNLTKSTQTWSETSQSLFTVDCLERKSKSWNREKLSVSNQKKEVAARWGEVDWKENGEIETALDADDKTS